MSLNSKSNAMIARMGEQKQRGWDRETTGSSHKGNGARKELAVFIHLQGFQKT